MRNTTIAEIDSAHVRYEIRCVMMKYDLIERNYTQSAQMSRRRQLKVALPQMVPYGIGYKKIEI
jgi:hypothetical protein